MTILQDQILNHVASVCNIVKYNFSLFSIFFIIFFLKMSFDDRVTWSFRNHSNIVI